MSYKRQKLDKIKQRNFVAKNDFNRGGYHTESKKSSRHVFKSKLQHLSLQDDLEQIDI